MDATIATRDAASGLEHYHRYYYHPSMAAAVLFTILFGIATALHFYQMIRTRTWFMVPFVLGGVFETVGYIGRALSASESPPYSLGPFITESVLLLVAPALFAASIYMELGRIVLMINGDKALFVRRTWSTKIFVTGDVICFLLQAGGAGLLSSGNASSIDTGNDMIIGGLFVQVVFFGLFVIAAALFHFKISRNPTPLALERPWRKHLTGLYIVSTLIFVRSIVRCVEYIQGFDGYILKHEVFLYVFDAVPMFFAVVSMNWSHPGEVARYVREDRGKTEVERGVAASMEQVIA